MTKTHLDEEAAAVVDAAGLPRTVLYVGASRLGSSAALRAKGARVTVVGTALDTEARAAVDEVVDADVSSDATTAPLAGRTFDLVVVGDALERARDPQVLLRTAVSFLVDGGHVLASPSNVSGQTARMLEGAGLELLWVRKDPIRLGAPRSRGGVVLVARRPPAHRALSLTVGMISMNEAGAVGAVIDDIRKHAPNAEVLLVDSSKDETPQIAEARGARVVRQFPPKGYGPAMQRLLYEATTDVVVTMDCDGTYPADRILSLHRMIEEGADLVNATRTRHRPEAMPLPNFIANRVFAGAAHVIHGLPTTDVHSGMRAYRTSMLRGISVDPKGPALPVALHVVPARLGYRIIEVEIPYFERVGATTLNRFDSTVWTFRRLLRARAGARVKSDRVETR
jgi:hypothetical protein